MSVATKTSFKPESKQKAQGAEDFTASYQDLVARFEAFSTKTPKDLSSDQDLTLAVMNLISIEEHLAFTGAKLEQLSYYDMLHEVRELRKKLMQQLLPNPKGEEWCISKHLLGASYRLLEVGSKQLAKGSAAASDFFKQSFHLYSLFWGIALKIAPTATVKEISEIKSVGSSSSDDDSNSSNGSDNKNAASNDTKSFKTKLQQLIKKVINCCIE